MRKYGGIVLLIAMALLAGCAGKDYEKIQGIGVAEESSRKTGKTAGSIKNREAQKGNQEADGESGGDREQKTEPDIVISDSGASAGEGIIISLEEDFCQEPDEGTEGMSSEGGEGVEEKPLILLFSGDVLLSSHVLNAYDRGGGIQGVLDETYRKQIQEADFFMVNQEFPFSDRGTAAEDKQYTFRLPPDRILLFQEMGIDGVTLANNHALDFGQEALLDSCEILDRAGILHTGAGKDLDAARRPVIVERKGKRIAVIGATRVIPVADWAAGGQHPGMLAAYDMTALLEEIRAQKQENDAVIVCIHWGIERDEQPQDYQRTMGRQMIDAGADLVIGSHPHVLQGMEYYKGKPIAYSLGNFVFGSSIPRTALLQVVWEGQNPVLRLIPGTSGAGYTRTVTKEGERQEFFRYMESISYGVSFEEDGTVVPLAEQAQP